MRETMTFLGPMELVASVAGDPSRPAVMLLHGWPHSRTLYDPVIDRLGERFRVVAFDLPSVGDSHGPPPSGEKAVLADMLLRAAEHEGARSIVVVGIDVGGMIAFAASRDHGSRIKGAIIGNTVIPGLDPWDELIRDPRIWHFAFHTVPDLPELLVAGHERAYFDFFFDFLGSKTHPLPDDIRDAFTRAYARPEALRAGFDWYRALATDAKHNAEPQTIETPILYFRGDADGRDPAPYVEGLRRAGAQDVRSVKLAGTAEFTPIEAPERFAEMVVMFADRCLERALA